MTSFYLHSFHLCKGSVAELIIEMSCLTFGSCEADRFEYELLETSFMMQFYQISFVINLIK